jgi:Tfp pilus assembly protein PilF
MATERAGVIKWIGAGTAVISLILGARQLVTIGTERAARARESAEAVAIARQQAARGDFTDAWKSLDRAEQQARTAESDAARLEVAFRWLQEARKPADQPFATITDAIVPTLDRALLDQQHPRRADIVAHLGWATFLKSRDRGEGDPEPLYRQALTIDPKNVYANIMLAHWLMWNRRSVEDARPYFEAAVASGKERPLVRRLQIAALRNSSSNEGDTELLRIANSMRQQNETPDNTSARTIYVVYRTRYATRSPYIDPNTTGVTVSDQLATLTWLSRFPGGSDRDGTDTRIVETLKTPPAPPPSRPGSR